MDINISYLKPQPAIRHMCTVAPDILAVSIQERKVVPGAQVPYKELPRDIVKEHLNKESGVITDYTVIRDGRVLGSLVGGRNGRFVYESEDIAGDPLDVNLADSAESYSICSKDDARFASGVRPIEVYRKSKPVNLAVGKGGFSNLHVIFLKMPSPFTIGGKYTIDFGPVNVQKRLYLYEHNPRKIRSDAVHASHIGYRPDDPAKAAFLSLWMGTGGRLTYPGNLHFQLIDEATDEEVYSGRIRLVKPAEDTEKIGDGKRNYNLTDVYKMDFSDFRKPGSYRVYVEGIGCSYPFAIDENAWEKAFKISMRGFYHNRSGIELGPPYTDFRRPRPYHPDDGVKVYHSTTPLLNSGNGLNALGTDKNNFGNLIAGRTDEIVPNAWGGYFDAGDWDRRIQHLEATRLHLELLYLAPEYFSELWLNLPESGNGLPDVLNEALWNVDCFRRLQTSEGGVRGGVEAQEHPRPGECSWQESLVVMSYAPDHWCSYIYAGIAARTAFWLRSRKPDSAGVYGDSALKAMEWAEREYKKWKNAPEFTDIRYEAKHAVESERNLAAVEIYRLTGDSRWHDLFAETRAWINQNAAFVYASMPDSMTNGELRKECFNCVIAAAEAAEAYQKGNAFGIASSYPNRYPHSYGHFYTVPDAVPFVRAHYLTGEERYLEDIVKACQVSAGANAANMTFTTGLGHDYPQNPMCIDSRRSGQKVPEGITVYGPADPVRLPDDWMYKWTYRDNLCTPAIDKWPPVETYLDIFIIPQQNEWTVMQTLGPVSYVWGYLAARK